MPEKPKPKPPAVLANLDMMLRAELEAKEAPANVMDAWEKFFDAACMWAAETGKL